MKTRYIALPGEEVIVNISDESRSWGYRPFANGEVLKVIEYSTIHNGRTNNFGNEPGLYYNTSWLTVEDKNGKRETVNHLHLQNMPGAEYGSVERAELRIGDLPETNIWEHDIVSRNGEVMKVIAIEYDSIGMFCNDGITPMPIYRCDLNGGGYSTFRESDLTLVERGNIWKRANGRRMEFESLNEEANFYQQVGEVDEVRNPSDGLYRWTKEEALDVIQQGVAHGFSSGVSPFTGTESISVIRFRNELVGERVRGATLVGFGREQPIELPSP